MQLKNKFILSNTTRKLLKALQYLCEIVFILTFTTLVHASHAKFIKYNFSYPNKINSTLEVSLSFRGDSSGQTQLILPSQIAEVNNLYQNIVNLRATNADIKKTADPKIYLLHYTPNKIIHITYQVKQGWQGALTDPQQSLIPIFQKNYFQFPGEGVLIYPKSYKNEKNLSITLNWQTPKKWVIANSYGTHLTHQTIKTNLSSVLRGLYIGGDFRLYPTAIKDGFIWTAIQGKWHFEDSEFNSIIMKIISGEQSFWNDHSPYYLVTLLPIGSGCKSGGGTGHTNSFSVFFNADCPATNSNILHILSHENFHNWNGHEIFFGELDKKKEVYYYWFSEGFTDYYANLLNLRAGLLNLEEYVKRYNKVLVDYYSSPNNSASIEKISENIWKDFNLERLVYQQGEILAHNWNAQIKLHTQHRSLDDLMRELFNFVKTGKYKLTPTKMSQIATQYHIDNVLKDILSLYSGKILIPDPNSLGPCVFETTKQLAKNKGKLKSIPQFVLDQSMWKKNPEKCLAWFNG